MKSIEPGMKVKCIKHGTWHTMFGGPWNSRHPVYGGVYIVADAYDDYFEHHTETFLVFDEFHGGWAAVNFVPFDSLSGLKSLLVDVKNPDHVREVVDA